MKYSIKDKIIELRNKGYSYKRISEELNCSKGTISYHIGIGQKDKYKIRRQKCRKLNPLSYKMSSFLNAKDKFPKSNLRTKYKNIRIIIYNKIREFNRDS